MLIIALLMRLQGIRPIFLCLVGKHVSLWMLVSVSTGNQLSASHLKYVAKMKQELQTVYRLAQASADKMNQSNKVRYDQKVRNHSLSPGDLVLIGFGLKGKQNLADRWSSAF